MEQITALDVLQLVGDRAQWCRENGESDMRNILNTTRYLKSLIDAGKTRDEIMAEFADDEDEG
jgi:hypothetical protein